MSHMTIFLVETGSEGNCAAALLTILVQCDTIKLVCQMAEILLYDRRILIVARSAKNVAPSIDQSATEKRMTTASGKSIHAGHRQRLRERLLTGGMDALAPHEMLELLLSYSMPRVDVNPLAHQLVDRFGSLSGVMEASEAELTAEPGVGERTACLIRLIPTIARRCAIDQAQKSTTYDTVGKLVDYLRPFFSGLTTEVVYLVLLDNGMHMIDCCCIAEGSVNSSAVTIRRIAELALYDHAACVVLAHNHPKGVAVPSSTDIDVTRQIESALGVLGIPLLEHLVITEHSHAQILRHHRSTAWISPVTGQRDAGFYESFCGLAEGEEA